MESKIIDILKEVVAIDSFSSTEKENKVTDYLYNYLNNIDYFKNNPEMFGNYCVENDYLNRKISYGLVKGESNKTVVFLNHYDVVGIDDYGIIKDYAFNIEELKNKISGININSEAINDLNSGEWIFGRGVADMKGGLAIQLSILEKYSQMNNKSGNILFLSVPDEESYSAGMRGAVKLLSELMGKYNLEYSFLINCEPNFKVNNKHVISLGTAGKCMPVVLVQGNKSHIAKCFDGLNPIGVLSDIFSKTELSLEFSDSFNGEVTVPPTWNYFKDMKNEYDVSIPLRASGYFSVISFYTSPDEILKKLKNIAVSSFANYVDKMQTIYREYKKNYKFCSDRLINYEPNVMTFEELINTAKENNKEEFTKFYEKLYDNISKKIYDNEINYPQATIRIMEEVLNFTGINYPIIILGFSPPYYPAVNSMNVKNKENKTMDYYETIKKFAQDYFNYDISYENYTVGLSDCSYCAIDKVFDFKKFSLNSPMWGNLYSIDFETIERLNIPFIIFGPWGKDFHQLTERVHKESLTEIVPQVIEKLIENIFKK